MSCWCGEENPEYAATGPFGLDRTCGGSGALYCNCGGDLCVCHWHGEAECDGCEDCHPDFQWDDEWEPPASEETDGGAL